MDLKSSSRASGAARLKSVTPESLSLVMPAQEDVDAHTHTHTEREREDGREGIGSGICLCPCAGPSVSERQSKRESAKGGAACRSPAHPHTRKPARTHP